MTSQSAGYVNQFFGDVWCPGQCNCGVAPERRADRRHCRE